MKMRMRGLRTIAGIFSLATMAAISAQATASVSFSNLTNAPAVNPLTNGTETAVTVTATPSEATITNATLFFRTWATLCTNTWNAVAMTNTSGTTWKGTIPRLPSGIIDYYVTCDFTGSGAVSPAISGTNSATVGGTLGVDRYETFEGAWYQTGDWDFHWYNSAGWTGIWLRVLGTNNTPSVRVGGLPDGSTNAVWLRNSATNAYLLSPILPQGIGTISCYAGLRGLGTYSETFRIDVSTNESTWDAYGSYTIPTVSSVLTPSISLNLRQPSRVRFIRTSYESGDSTSQSAIVLDGIRITLPPADMTLSPAATPVSPPTPQSQQPTTLSCQAVDASTNTPTINRRLTCFYSLNSNAWTAAAMTPATGQPNLYQAVIATADGTNRYFFRCDFDGYYYTNSDKPGPAFLPAGGSNAPSSYTVNFASTAIIRLTGSLAFGQVATNSAATNTLTVWNDGNAALNVTGFVFTTAGYVAQPAALPFLVAAGGSVGVPVVFAPSAVQTYDGTLQVLSEKTGGPDTIAYSGAGLPAQTVSTPTLSGPATGTVGDLLNYTASGATHSWGYNVLYRYGFGDGATSSWTAATSTSHVWSTTGTFAVVAQACSASNTALVSGWSLPVSVTVTNTRIIGVGGSLAFGSVATNARPALSIIVTNTGNGPLTVTNVTSVSGVFTAVPAAFVLAPGAGTNVAVTFAPIALQSYAETLTVWSDATSGSNTLAASGTGIPAETVSQPTLTGDGSGTLLQPLSFTASGAVDNHTNSVQYQFDWGDGQTSVWSAAVASGGSVATSHAWAATNTYLVRAAARGLGVVSPWSAALSVTITNTRIIGLAGPLDFGSVVTNTAWPLTLTLTNAGNGTLTVTNITSTDAAFALSKTALQLAPYAGTNLTVAFTPTTTNSYQSVLTVWSDCTSGSNTINATGSGKAGEAVSQPALSGPSGATIDQTLTFVAANAADNYTNNIQYFFDWGDGSTSGWMTAVSSGAAATNTHAWATANTYTVRAQARSAVSTTVVSAWAQQILSITNIRIIGVNGTLVFGQIATNATATNTFTVGNTGNGPLQVASVSTPAGFMASPQSFTVPVSGSTTVTVIFAPSAIQSYSGTVTVNGNATSGGNTLSASGTGMPVESMSTPVLSGPLAGTRGDTNTYTVSTVSTDNWGAATAEYLYDWGDATTSGWTTATSFAHTWGVASTNQVRVRARNQATPALLSDWSPVLNVVLYGPPSLVLSTSTNGLPISVAATISAAGAVSNAVLYYLPPNSSGSFTTLGLAGGPTVWNGVLPALSAGTLHYYLQYWQNGVALRYPATGDFTTTVSGSLYSLRRCDFEDTWTGPLDYDRKYYNSAGWTGLWLRVEAYTASPSLRPDGSLDGSLRATWLRNSPTNAFLISPVQAAGIGSIYFYAGMRFSGYSAAFIVQVSTDGGANWVTYGTFAISGSTILNATVPVNLRQPAMVRFLRTSYNTVDTTEQSALVIDNINISPPATDVTLSEVLHNPGYPSAKDPVKVRCAVSDVDANAPSVNRRVTCYYKHETAASFTATNLTDVGGGLFEGYIPVLPQGTLSYYFKCDFDGYYYSTTVGGVATNENVGTEYLGALGTQRTQPGATLYLTYQINLFRSDTAGVSLNTTNQLVTVEEKALKLVDDYTWQGQVLMKKIGLGSITNLPWFFNGNLYYATNASSFVPVLTWGDLNQDFPYPPLGGIAERNATNNPLQVTMEYDGILLFRFNTVTGDYLVKRAVFQDFNSWQANQNYFETSVGLYTTDTFTNDFSAWSTNAYDSGQSRGEDFNGIAPDVWAPTPQVDYYQGWMYELGYVMRERPATYGGAQNQALLLNGQSTAPGKFWNRKAYLTEVGGLHNMTFRQRLAVNDAKPTLWTRYASDTNWNTSYRVVATNRVQAMAPGTNTCISLLMNYRQDTWDPTVKSYYEWRLSQPSDAQLQLQLLRWVNGTATPVYAPGWVYTSNLTNGSPIVFDLTWSYKAPSTVSFTGTVSRAGQILFNMPTNAAGQAIVQDTSAPASLGQGGLIGFACSDVVPEVDGACVYIGSPSATNEPKTTLLYNALATIDPGGWFLGGTRASDNQSWWQFTSTTNLVRPLPAILPILTLYTAGTANDSATGPDLALWTNVWSNAVSALTYSSVTVPFNRADRFYTKLQFNSGDLPIVIDDINEDPWCAVTRGQAFDWNSKPSVNGVFYYDWTSAFPSGQQAQWVATQPDFAVLQGWVGQTVIGATTNRWVTFDRTRALAGLVQGIFGPPMSHGIGSVAFQSTVLSGTSVFTVEVTSPTDPNTWNVWATFTNTPADGAINRFLPVRQLGSGRVRIQQLPGNLLGSGSSSNAVLALDNLVILGYPPPDTSSWKVYNALVARPSTNNDTLSRAFEPTAFSHQTCYLNDGPTNGVLLPNVWIDDNPYLQSPEVGTGIGEIGFWCRAWTNKPAYLRIMAADSASAPSASWVTITNLVITNTDYAYVDLQNLYYPDYKVVRFCTETNALLFANCTRLAMDNVLVAEPIRAGYEITAVSLLPTQPLFSDEVAVQARIGRFLMNPQGIRLFLSYYDGTSPWGYGHWRGIGIAPSNGNGCVTVEMESLGSNNLFRTPAGQSIPRRATDAVVQFEVWGVYSNMTGRPIFQGTNTFANPAWYYPVDLNDPLQNPAAATAWSPYYYVYSCPPGSVWINEFNYVVKGLTENGYEYVELCGHAGIDISNWKLDIIDPNNNFAPYSTATVPGGTTIQDLTYDPYGNPRDGAADGWGFWVWGGSWVWPPPDLYGNDNQRTLLLGNAGIRLTRSMGAYEERICYGPSDITRELESRGYIYVGSKWLLPPWEAPLQVQGTGSGWTNGVSYATGSSNDFYWYQPSSWSHTPGSMNVDENLNAYMPNPVSSFTITSVIGPNGIHTLGNDPIAPLVSVTLAAGSSTSIVYTADQWFRIAGVTTNGVDADISLVTTQYTWTVDNLQADCSNNVTFYRPQWTIDAYPVGSGSVSPAGTLTVPNGLSTTVTFTASQWFQIQALATNGVLVPAASGQTAFTQTFFQVQANYSNDVAFLRPSWTISQVVGANGSASPAGTVTVLNGLSTSIVYTAADWFRIRTVTTNGQNVAGVAGTRTGTVTFAQVTGNITNNAVFTNATPQQLGGSFPTNVPVSWVAGFHQSESTPFDNDGYSLRQEYVLDTNPYVSNRVSLAVASLGITNKIATVNVRLLVDQAVHGHINGILHLYGTDSLRIPIVWDIITNTDATGNVFDGSGIRSYQLSTTNSPSGFCKPVIE